MTFDEAAQLPGNLKRRGSPVVWFKILWGGPGPELYARIKLDTGDLVKAPITLTTEDLTATDWELAPPEV
jgi:hypothetical protein